MNKVVIKSYSGKSNDAYGDFMEMTEIIVNGNTIGMFDFGGEPEDNCRSRDYSWVEPLLEKLATSLGAEVKVEKIENIPKGW